MSNDEACAGDRKICATLAQSVERQHLTKLLHSQVGPPELQSRRGIGRGFEPLVRCNFFFFLQTIIESWPKNQPVYR